MEKLQPDVIHAHYPGLALSLALTRTAGTIPIIAIVHGPDVMAADRSSKGCESLNEVAAASAAIVVPTPALADHVDRLTGRRVTDQLTIIPWGIPLSGVQVRDRPPAELARSPWCTPAASTTTNPRSPPSKPSH